jgi:hypothetical protein
MWLRILVVFCLFPLVIFGWLLIERLSGKAALVKYERELRSKGEKTTIAELILPVPEGENGAADVIRLCGALQEGKVVPDQVPPQMRLVAPGKAMRGASRNSWLSDSDKHGVLTNYWDEIVTDIELNQQTLQELRSALRKPVLYKRLNYEAGFEHLDMNHLMVLKRGARWLATSGVNHLNLGENARALEEIEALGALLRMQENEHLAINQLVRWAIQWLATALTWEALESDGWHDGELERMQKAWASLDFIGPVAPALRMERAVGRLHFEEARRSAEKLAEAHAWREVSPIVDVLTGSSAIAAARNKGSPIDTAVAYVEKNAPEAVWKGIIYPVWQFAWSHRDQRQSWLILQTLIDATNTGNKKDSAFKLDEAEAKVDSMSQPSGLNRLRFFLSSMGGALSHLPKRGFQAQAHAKMVVTAIALKRYKLKHGRYPDRLEDLVPQFLARAPIDHTDGGKLRYRLDDNDFTLWSVGPDGKDDGGNPGTIDKEGNIRPIWRAPDAVWPRRASDGEILQYEQRKFGR